MSQTEARTYGTACSIAVFIKLQVPTCNAHTRSLQHHSIPRTSCPSVIGLLTLSMWFTQPEASDPRLVTISGRSFRYPRAAWVWRRAPQILCCLKKLTQPHVVFDVLVFVENLQLGRVRGAPTVVHMLLEAGCVCLKLFLSPISSPSFHCARRSRPLSTLYHKYWANYHMSRLHQAHHLHCQPSI